MNMRKQKAPSLVQTPTVHLDFNAVQPDPNVV